MAKMGNRLLQMCLRFSSSTIRGLTLSQHPIRHALGRKRGHGHSNRLKQGHGHKHGHRHGRDMDIENRFKPLQGYYTKIKELGEHN